MLVGVAGFEPTTSSSRTKRATKLRHTPMKPGQDSGLGGWDETGLLECARQRASVSPRIDALVTDASPLRVIGSVIEGVTRAGTAFSWSPSRRPVRRTDSLGFCARVVLTSTP